MSPEHDPFIARNHLAEAALGFLVEIGRSGRAGSRYERLLVSQIATALAAVDAAVVKAGGATLSKETP